MKKILAITPPPVRYGFSLAGIEQRTCTADKAHAAVAEALEDRDTGLVILDERLLEQIHEKQLKALERRSQAVLIVLPAPEQTDATEDYALRLVRRAIGYHVRLNP